MRKSAITVRGAETVLTSNGYIRFISRHRLSELMFVLIWRQNLQCFAIFFSISNRLLDNSHA